MSVADNILSRVKACYQQATLNYRDSMLECGRLLHEFTIEKLKNGCSRAAIMEESAAALGEKKVLVYRLVAVSQVVKLLSGPEGIGDLAFWTLRNFVVLIRRCNNSDAAETWEIKPGCRDVARELFSRAVAEHWSEKDAFDHVPRFGAPRLASKIAARRRGRREVEYGDVDPCEVEAAKEQRRQLVHPAVKKCSPRDAAKLLYDTLLENDDPNAVARYLKDMLEHKRFLEDVREKQHNERLAS